jgi:hypothetical protein
LSVEHAYIYIYRYTKQDTIFVQRNDGTPFTPPSIPKLPQSHNTESAGHLHLKADYYCRRERESSSRLGVCLCDLPPLSLVDMLQATDESFGT